MNPKIRKFIVPVLVIAIAGGAYYAWQASQNAGPGPGFAKGNGRIEATEIDVSTKLAGRVESIAVNEGDFVTTGQPLAAMQIDVLEAQRDEAKANLQKAINTVAGAKAQVAAADAAIEAARAQVVGAESAVTAAQATIARIEADIKDSQLIAPRDGRVQYRVAQPGEVLGAGGKVLNFVDLSDVYMTFFLPATEAGKVALGSEARIILDAAPQLVIPASVSFVASTAQFTPKTVETASEREKLMFRVKARIDPELLRKHLTQVKTGLPGVTWVKIDSNAQWPESLQVRLPE
ncbi:HlyD family secretion protein [Kerstersia gyiorum]|uniref:HlyD family secretion protein n=1 Tax=Kerstersia gyiorum TaxID=206506 RepID=UPI00209E9E8B|nr:efflux RND transporter periplasmic adaptor subunit [Kerstersia gyiorum]MCP1636524.1 HlyD family secretion protein [Kerstersia gyiorum]